MDQALGAQAGHSHAARLVGAGCLRALVQALVCDGGRRRRRRPARAQPSRGGLLRLNLAGVAAHRARGQGRRDAELDLLGVARVFGRRGDAVHAERQRKRRVGARLRAQVAADRAQGRSARPGAELGLLGGEAAEVMGEEVRLVVVVATGGGWPGPPRGRYQGGTREERGAWRGGGDACTRRRRGARVGTQQEEGAESAAARGRRARRQC